MSTRYAPTGARDSSPVMFASFAEAARRTGLSDSATGFAALCERDSGTTDTHDGVVHGFVDLRTFAAVPDEPVRLDIEGVEILEVGRLP